MQMQQSSKKRSENSTQITFSIAINKLQEIDTTGTEVAGYNLTTSNLTAVESILALPLSIAILSYKI